MDAYAPIMDVADGLSSKLQLIAFVTGILSLVRLVVRDASLRFCDIWPHDA